MNMRLLVGSVALVSIVGLPGNHPAIRVAQAGVREPLPVSPVSQTVGVPSFAVSLPAVKDATLAADAPDMSGGNSTFPFLEVDYWHLPGGGPLTYVRVFLIQFDLSSLPADATIDSATMVLRWNACTSAGTYPVQLAAYWVSSSWDENTVTYNTRPSWATMGVGPQVACPPAEFVTAWSITSFAQAWWSDPAQNNGLMVRGPWSESTDYSIAYNSREYPGGSPMVPELVVTYHLPSMAFYSAGAYDGWVLESGETTNKGGSRSVNSPTLRVGDNAAKKQYRSILSFELNVPGNVQVYGISLQLCGAGRAGKDPFKSLGSLVVDVKRGFFGSKPTLQLGDFQAGVGTAGRKAVLSFTSLPTGSCISKDLASADWGYVNLAGTTQFRLRFAKDDNNNGSADFLKIHSGNAALLAYRPALIISYNTP